MAGSAKKSKRVPSTRNRASVLNRVPNLDRGLRVLELLSGDPSGFIAAEIAEQLTIPRNSMSRILAALQERGYVRQDGRTKQFKLTQRMLALGRSAVTDFDLTEESLPFMRALRDDTGDTVMLSTRIRQEGVILAQVPSLHPVRLTVDPGLRYGLHCSAPGKISLAWMPKTDQREFLRTLPLPRYTKQTITRRRDLEKELLQAKKLGYAVDRGEGYEGIQCVSSPILSGRGELIAELTVTGPSTRINEKTFASLAVPVKEQAAALSKRLRHWA